MSPDGFAARPIKRETLPDQMAGAITDLILSGSIEPGSALPTEPQLAEQYGVSRSVVRDATRLLSARGLVEIRHGKGVFVTASQKEPFSDAFLLALRRHNATVFDAEEFSDLFFPVVVSLATTNATDEEIEDIAALVDEFLRQTETFNAHAAQLTAQGAQAVTQEAQAALLELIRTIEQTLDHVYEAVYAATHNRVMQQLSAPVLMLRRLNLLDLSQAAGKVNSADVEEVDRAYFNAVLECLRSRDPERAHALLPPLVLRPPEVVAVMRETPIGVRPLVQLASPFPTSREEDKSNG
ncbi:FadR/GntR family transcriptional regulator [Candidatus Bipolaricaulota bacterium]